MPTSHSLTTSPADLKSQATLVTRRLAISIATFACLLAALQTPATAWQQPGIPALWDRANTAYRTGDKEAGHNYLRQLIDENPGDYELAVRCLDRIRETAGRHDINNPWIRYAVRRLCALERIGAVSANSRTSRVAMETHTAVLEKEGRRFEAVDRVTQIAEENPHDVAWRILRAQVLRRTDSRAARPLYEHLRRDMDLDHPDKDTRDRWTAAARELESDLSGLPRPIEPLPSGSPLALMELDDPDGRWQTVANHSPRESPRVVDRLAGQALVDDQFLMWRDTSGLMDPARALDLHLIAQPRPELLPLRALQAELFDDEELDASPSAGEIRAVSRRYPWAAEAQRLLMRQANADLLAGRCQAALRSFRDVLNHADIEAIRDEARVGLWAALAQIGPSKRLVAEMRRVEPGKKFPWLGERLTAAEIANKLARRPQLPSRSAPRLSDLSIHPVRIPPVSPWSVDTPGAACVDLQLVDGRLAVSSRNLLALYDGRRPDRPLWQHVQRHPAEENRPGNYAAGYFRPTFAAGVVYVRWGFTSVPTGIAAFERDTGRPLWSNESSPFSQTRRRTFHVPVGDPVLSDGLLYYLQWNTLDNVNHNQTRRLTLVCFDPARRRTRWDARIVASGHASDFQASFERAAPQAALYGNRVTVDDGAVYSNSNAGVIARSDVRDGRVDWIHYYRRGPAGSNNLGAAPVVVGDLIVCLPRDGGGRVFALDRATGRLVWDNARALGVQLVGVLENRVLVRGQTTLAALDARDGKVAWYLPIRGAVLGRAQLIGDSIYLAQRNELRRLNARTGRVVERRRWQLDNERPQAVLLDGNQAYVVTDKPQDESRAGLGQPLAVSAPATSTDSSLTPAWSLPRTQPRLAVPPSGSPLQGKAYVVSGGILECVEIAAPGAIRWRRFVQAPAAGIHFFDDLTLVVEHLGGRDSTRARHLVALDGEDGRVRWTAPLGDRYSQLLPCDSAVLFHDGRSGIVGFDPQTGRTLWKRAFGPGLTMTVAYRGGAVEVLYLSAERVAWHFVVDPLTGQTRTATRLETGLKSGEANNGKLVADGYYEVLFPARSARYIRLVALSEINGQGWTSIAELHVVGEDADNVSRQDWKCVKVDSQETKSRYDTSPEAAFDDDPVTWWHTKWIGGIPRHPHEIQIDLGRQQTIRGIRYLPAVIINNNGMIRDYELFSSNDGKNWSEPVAKGVLVNRPHIERPAFAAGAVFFEARNYQRRHTYDIYRYALDGKPARLWYENARLVSASGSYVVVSVPNKPHQGLTVLRSDQPDYRFELTSEHPLHREGELTIDGDRLILGRRSLVVADLNQRRYIVPPTKDGLAHNRSGVLAKAGNRLLKFVHQGNRGQAVFNINLETGDIVETGLADQFEPFQQPPTGGLVRFKDVLVLSTGSSITGWVVGD